MTFKTPSLILLMIYFSSEVICREVSLKECGGCLNQGICEMIHDHEPTCTCTDRFYGRHCEIDMFEKFGFDCRYDGNCSSHGECIAISGVCRCNDGYYGERCEFAPGEGSTVSISSVIGISIGLAAVVIILLVYLCMRYGIGQIIRDRRTPPVIPVLTVQGSPCRLHKAYHSAEFYSWSSRQTDFDKNLQLVPL